MALTALLSSFLIFMVAGLPIAFNLLIGAAIYLLVGDYNIILIPQRMYEGMNGFSLLSVPFFVLTGTFMMRGKLLDSLINLTKAFFGHVRGALALVTVGTCLMMGSIVGLAVASAASLGSFLIPMMKKEGYSPAFAAGVMTTGALLGPIMPPSVLMILYCIAVGKTSIAGIFLGAVIPALLITMAQMTYIYFKAKKEKLPAYPPMPWPDKWKTVRAALPAMLLPVIILGGIFSGMFTVTEASAIACAYSALLAFVVNKAIKLRELPEIFAESALTSGLVILLAGAGTVVAWAIANEQVVNLLIEPLSALPPWLFLLMVNILLLINGMFMDDYASVVVIAPILAPIAWNLGIDPIHIGLVICINLVIGLSTPPFGVALFVTSPLAGVKIEQTVKEALPLIIVTTAVLFLITFVPQICLFLPRMFGY